MGMNNKFFETGSNPFYLNSNNTAKDFSYNNDLTNPNREHLVIIDIQDYIEDPIIIDDKIIIQEHTSLEG